MTESNNAVVKGVAKGEFAEASAEDEKATVLLDAEKGEKAIETFVDFVPPPRPPVPPPAKYKLVFIIFITIYCVTLFADQSGIMPCFMKGGLRKYGALFCLFMIEVFIMVFCGVELVIGLVRIKICGTWYGFLPWILQPRCQWVRESDNVFIEFLEVIVDVAENGFSIFEAPYIPPPPPKITVFDLVDKEKQAVLKAQHKVNPDKSVEYNVWTAEMIKYMETQPGFVSAIEEGVDEDYVHTWLLKFENVNALNSCMATPYWTKMIGELKPLLDAPKVTQILTQNPPLNAFADMMTLHGESLPVLPPKKWKVWWVTVCALFFAFLIIENTLGVYFVRWGWVNWNPYVFRIVNIGSLVLVLNYLTVPFLQLLIHHWFQRKPDEQDAKFPWKQLNDGVIPPFQLIGFLAYFISTGVVWATKQD